MAASAFKIIFFIFLLFIYFLPTVIAFRKNKRNVGAILALNLFLGWTLIVWIVALVWASADNNKPETIIVNNHVSADRIINPDKINQLQQLKQLLDTGTLTQNEFDQQKSQILAY